MSHENGNTLANAKRVLGRGDLMAMAIGQIIGAGIMALTGVAIGYTGKGASFAFLGAAVFTLCNAFPMVLLSGTVRLRGGQYTQASILLGKTMSGVYAIMSLIGNMSVAMFALSFADYFRAIVPGAPRQLVAFLILTLLVVMNLLGVKSASIVQKVMVACLAGGIAVFICFGLGKVQPDYFTSGGWMPNGIIGFLTASSTLAMATGGATNMVNFGAEAKNPTKDIPMVIIVSTLLVAAIYFLMGIVATGVLPIPQVANKSLSETAKVIFPAPVYVFFIVGTAWFAITSTLNSILAWAQKPVLQAANDGFFPKWMGITNKNGVAVSILALFYVLGLIAIFTGLNIQSISSFFLVLNNAFNIFLQIAIIRMPKVLKKEWENSKYKVPMGVVVLSGIIGSGAALLSFSLQFAKLTPVLVICNIVVFAFAALYSSYRIKKGYVTQEVSYEES